MSYINKESIKNNQDRAHASESYRLSCSELSNGKPRPYTRFKPHYYQQLL
jgi:hypothetical protein